MAGGALYVMRQRAYKFTTSSHGGKGGANHPMNLVTLCWRCHAAVHGSIMGDEYTTAAGCEKGMTPEDVRREVMFYMELEITRYISDYYAEQGEIWYPWDG